MCELHGETWPSRARAAKWLDSNQSNYRRAYGQLLQRFAAHHRGLQAAGGNACNVKQEDGAGHQGGGFLVLEVASQVVEVPAKTASM